MPEELWLGYTPSMDHLGVFGCMAYVHVPKELRKKLDSKAKELIFIGNCEDSKGYRLVDPETKKITENHDSPYVLSNLFREYCERKYTKFRNSTVGRRF